MSAYLPGAASLAEQLDTRLLILLRDKRTILGTLRSFDQYLNLILEDTVERIYHQSKSLLPTPVSFSIFCLPLCHLPFPSLLPLPP